jgi:class 3 adenylate cyclase
MMVDQINRTFICSVVFVDLVDYSRKSVSVQLAIKDRFTATLGEALKDVAVHDRIVLDTGDGAAMSFLGDPEDALFIGLSLRDVMKTAAPQPDGGAGAAAKDDGSLRIGINLGPVRLVRDINGHPNIVGDGINVAQRIMSFAQPGQILVSRSYYDVVSCLSEEYAKLFSYDGARTDKHVREHEVYVVGESESAFTHAKAGMENRAAQTNPRLRAGPGPGGARGARIGAYRFSAAAVKEAATAFFQDRRKVTIAGGVLGAVVVLLAALLVAVKPSAPPVRTAAAPPQGAPAPSEPPRHDAASEKAAATTAGVEAPQIPAKGAGAKPQARKAEAPGAAPGTLNLAVAPWGEVYVNGKSRGVSPPMKNLKLPPGKYKIEIRNTNFAPRVEVVQVKSREEVTIRHLFK